MGIAFVQLRKGAQTEMFLKKKNAFMLLTQIAIRAKRAPGEPKELEIGEALIGDHDKIGLSRQEYRSALNVLKNNHQITIKATTKGTIAKIIDTSYYDINSTDEQPSNFTNVTIKQPSSNH